MLSKTIINRKPKEVTGNIRVGNKSFKETTADVQTDHDQEVAIQTQDTKKEDDKTGKPLVDEMQVRRCLCVTQL